MGESPPVAQAWYSIGHMATSVHSIAAQGRNGTSREKCGGGTGLKQETGNRLRCGQVVGSLACFFGSDPACKSHYNLIFAFFLKAVRRFRPAMAD